jgi:hypothetical protein
MQEPTKPTNDRIEHLKSEKLRLENELQTIVKELRKLVYESPNQGRQNKDLVSGLDRRNI